jgi:UDP-N-acetylglucosamine--N-acetylmuramyl-(pentapeptide) pyrophosphoryl-undecaprenol N-acetylglucosamine transferase
VSGSATLAFTGGGSGGHVYPGLAVIESLRGRGFAGRMLWIGSSKESDRRAVEAAGVEYRAVPAGKLRREFSLENAADLFRVAAGYFASLAILREARPALLFSKGGYVSVPPCAAAASLGIPYFTHESDLTTGLATRLNAGRAERIVLTYENTFESLPAALKAKSIVAGNPVRRAIRRGDAARGRELLGAAPGLPVLLFLGGSQGARQLNELVEALLPALAGRATVVHQRGEADGSGRYPASAAYHPFAYIRDELPDILAAADLVVSRAGAGSLWECAALAKPMILVPLCGAGTRGDQVDNAAFFAEGGAATSLVGPEAAPMRLLAEILAFLGDPPRLAATGAAAFRLAGRDAAETIAGLIFDRIGGRE